MAHPISLTSATLSVGTDSVEMSVWVPFEDLVLYYEIPSQEASGYGRDPLRRAGDQHQSFLLERLYLLDQEGDRLEGSVVSVDDADLNTSPVPTEALMERGLRYQLRFQTPAELTWLTILQRFGEEDAPVPAVMDLEVERDGRLLAAPIQLLSGHPHTLSLASEDPRPEGESQWEQLRRQKERQVRERLGIVSYAALYSFIYVDARELRHELLIPLLTLETWMPVERQSAERLTVDEQQALVPKLAAFFREHAAVEINGVATESVLGRAQFFGVSIQDFARNAEPREISVYQGRVGVILRYPSETLVSSVRVPWSVPGEGNAVMQSRIFVREEPAQAHRFWKDQAEWSWESPTSGGVVPELGALPPVPEAPAKGVRVRVLFLAGLVSVAALAWLSGFLGRGRGGSMVWGGALVLGCVAVSLVWLGRVSPPNLDPAEDFRFEGDEVIASTLLNQIYAAFDERDEDSIYERLAAVVSADLLESLYLEFRDGLRMREQGGAVARVQSCRVVDQEVLRAVFGERGGYERVERLDWEVTGTVEHWGHVHQRSHRYRAEATLVGEPEGWRLAELQVLDLVQTPLETTIRR